MKAPVLVLLVAGVAVAAWLLWPTVDAVPDEPTAEKGDPIKHFCTRCHLHAEPSVLPRSSWKEEIDKMYEFAGLDEEIDQEGIPPIEDVLKHYLANAPEKVPPPLTYLRNEPGPLRFDVRAMYDRKGSGVSFLSHVAFPGEVRNLLGCDMRSGEVFMQKEGKLLTLARLSNPCQIDVVDLDGDGLLDLLVAELGSFLPEDHKKGKVVWLRGRADGGVDVVPLLEDVGRVADVSAGDFDGDGDLDLVVAVFGWRRTGKLILMTNTGELDDRGAPKFDVEQLDPRVGTINVPVVDVDGDGKLDVVVLFSQHHETVVAFLNDGDGWFYKRTIYEAPHPDWGSSGIEVVDIEGDGDLDVVMVCGDTLDTGTLHRHQGVYLLENRGKFPFSVRKLAHHVGAHKVRAADLDGDGDLDLAASSFLPQLRQPGRPSPRLDSVIWIEQTGKGEFVPHPLEASRCDHAALEVGDFDSDGDVDIAVGNLLAAEAQRAAAWTVFDNAGRR